MKISAILLYVGIVGGTVSVTYGVTRYLVNSEVKQVDNSKEITALADNLNTYIKQSIKNDSIQLNEINAIKEKVNDIQTIKTNTATTAKALSDHIKNQGNFDKRAIELIEILAPIIYEKKNELTQELNEIQLDENGMLNLK